MAKGMKNIAAARTPAGSNKPGTLSPKYQKTAASHVQSAQEEESEREEPITIVNETKIFSRVSTVTREITSNQARALKKMCKDFMANGLEEYRIQQRHWTEMFEV